jgi:hypothetical protein
MSGHNEYEYEDVESIHRLRARAESEDSQSNSESARRTSRPSTVSLSYSESGSGSDSNAESGQDLVVDPVPHPETVAAIAMAAAARRRRAQCYYTRQQKRVRQRQGRKKLIWQGPHFQRVEAKEPVPLRIEVDHPSNQCFAALDRCADALESEAYNAAQMKKRERFNDLYEKVSYQFESEYFVPRPANRSMTTVQQSLRTLKNIRTEQRSARIRAIQQTNALHARNDLTKKFCPKFSKKERMCTVHGRGGGVSMSSE